MNKNNDLIRCILFLVFIFSNSQVSAGSVQINGIELYYEIHGSGTPLVLLHGGYDDSDMWQVETWILAAHYQVIEIDSRGHGRSTDSDAPITYELMADDTLKLLDHLNIANAHFVGWSDGAVIASYIAANQPQRVNQLVLFGAAYQQDAYIELFDFVLSNKGVFDLFVDNTFGLKYRATSPTPGYWPIFRDKLYTLWRSPCYFAEAAQGHCLESLQRISAPTLVVAGELEIIKASHTQAIAQSIPGASLKTVAFAGHFLPKFRPVTSANIVMNFLH
ncbi:alpha/beta hydrolase fold protein [Oleiphilus messinensis]|uniref:Alpha/beta hydrolase fold protein n=1 Tax=Oleiphilus messinensis TaxID=141451 RepID=A0A1Y0I6R4_9GAMM|nr:alpha/beta fold hydrolase [Oleiphilus messinensis]ARU55215.1 alpha/beta hydrolase fold protein [Oleiphilus messinensis]